MTAEAQSAGVTAASAQDMFEAELDESQRQVLTFALASERFAIKVTRVQEILDIVAMTPVPNADPFAPAVINVRGNVVPLIDLRQRFGLPPKPEDAVSRTVVFDVTLTGEVTRVAAMVDAVHDVVPIEQMSLEEIPEIGTRWDRRFVRGIARIDDHLTIVLALDNVFNLDRVEDDHRK